MTISADDIAHWQSWAGRTETSKERMDAGVLRRFAAALGESLDVEQVQPSLAHWGFFLPATLADAIGTDGHPERGGLLPPVTLPRRMFAGSEINLGEPLALGEMARRVSTIAAVTHKTGKSGELVLVEIEHEIAQRGRVCVNERQTLVYRGEGAPTTAVVPQTTLQPGAPGDTMWRPGPVELFRFSAVTFNSHRIHYDLPYATRVEGYPGLVVQGPLTAARLYRQATRGRRPARFGFRAIAPLFAEQPIRVTGNETNGQVAAVRCDGVVAMRATVGF
ncbi:MAG: MaoC family dehydratase N-terminal domain-containing protein [Caulobacter sp.]|nr:MaoC family dehydratase N-terminal domain-containing protein [Caulobacter sp.]